MLWWKLPRNDLQKNKIAVKLDNMAPEKRILCEKFFEDIMFEGQMETLHQNSLQINAS